MNSLKLRRKMSIQKRNDPLLSSQNPWNQSTNSTWIGSSLILHRNIEKFNFPGKLNADKKKQIIALLQKSLLSSKELINPKLILADEIELVGKEFLVEHFLSNQNFQLANLGEAFLLDETNSFLAVLNLQDHLQLQSISASEDFENNWSRLVKIESEVMQTINFSFSSKFGFLASDFAQCGTGIVATLYLHLPALSYADCLNELFSTNRDEGIELTGLQGNPNEFIGDIIALKNRYTLGSTEDDILSSLRSLAIKMMVEEKSFREHLSHENESEQAKVKDLVSRAFAVLMHSYRLEEVESLKALSSLKLGLDFNWIKGTSQSTLNMLLFSCRRAHLLCHYKQKISQDELPHRRAEFFHQTLKGLELLI
jgi:protein arginine kinase